jgi:4-hydroxy-tetrahydrodipicolinate synthase
MVLPPYVYRGDWREMKAHMAAVYCATPLSSMLYNNPVAYGTDFLPTQIAELAMEHENFEAVKESSADVRRVTAIRALLGDRLKVSVGVDDAIVEAIAAGAVGWVAGLVNAFPAESVRCLTLPWQEKEKKPRRSIAGSCRCCAWIRCRSSFNSSTRRSMKQAPAMRACVRLDCS